MINALEVKLDNQLVGKLSLTQDGLCAFQYHASYMENGVSISPFYLPLKAGVFIAKRQPFDGNFGVFNDSLPDGWGNLLLDQYLLSKKINPHTLTQLQRLSLIGSTGRGALEYYPDKSPSATSDTLDLDTLATEAENILNAKYSGSLDQFYQHGGASGGARPKIFITIDDCDWLIKFKGSADTPDVGIQEYRYSQLAQQCGIEMPETRLFEGKYFGVKRFDRCNNSKQHIISVAGLLNANYRIPSLDYIGLLTACLKITNNMEEVYQLFRIMVFNVVIKNRDDHAKNFSFMLIDQKWQLTPAYDLLPSTGFNGYHTTTVNGQGNPTTKDCLEVAHNIGLNRQRTKQIIDEITTQLASIGSFK